eukprot:11168474-Alexandrium_andersonii.AAC.1
MLQNVWLALAKAAVSWRFRAELVQTVGLPHRDERPKLSQPVVEQVAVDGRAQAAAGASGRGRPAPRQPALPTTG